MMLGDLRNHGHVSASTFTLCLSNLAQTLRRHYLPECMCRVARDVLLH